MTHSCTYISADPPWGKGTVIHVGCGNILHVGLACSFSGRSITSIFQFYHHHPWPQEELQINARPSLTLPLGVTLRRNAGPMMPPLLRATPPLGHKHQRRTSRPQPPKPALRTWLPPSRPPHSHVLVSK